MYVEMEKQIGQRDATRSDGMLKAGSLFRLIVDDSAPRAVNESESADYNRSFVGAKGDSVTFKVYDSEGSYGALFVDSTATTTLPSSALTARTTRRRTKRRSAPQTKRSIGGRRTASRARLPLPKP